MPQPWVLTYLTIFKSRLGALNQLLQLTGFTHQPIGTLQRRLKESVEQKVEIQLDNKSNEQVLRHLLDKGLVSATRRRSGRYQGFSLSASGGLWTSRNSRGDSISALPVYLVDVWMCDPRLRSTVGAPTPENVAEIIEFAYQLRLISKVKNTWTAGGHLVHALGTFPVPPDSHPSTNPFVLGAELPAFLRQIVDTDGLLVRELVRELVGLSRCKRDEIAERFDSIVERAISRARATRLSTSELQDLLKLQDAVRNAERSRGGKSGGPGVIEHRLSPRLEWLTDLGYLSKDGFPRNAFEYRVGLDLEHLLESLDLFAGSNQWGAEVASREWSANRSWETLREGFARYEGVDRITEAYKILKRSIGPVHLEELLFLAVMLSSERCDFSNVSDDLLQFAQETPGVRLSGGRYRRTPENIFIPDNLLGGK